MSKKRKQDNGFGYLLTDFVGDDEDAGIAFGAPAPPRAPQTKKAAAKTAAAGFMDEVLAGLTTKPTAKPKPKPKAKVSQAAKDMTKAKTGARATIRAFANMAKSNPEAAAFLRAAAAFGGDKKSNVRRMVKVAEAMHTLLQKDP